MNDALLVSMINILSLVIVTYGSTCGQPTSPYGSVIIHPSRREKYQNGDVILFGCKQGFYLDGIPIITCNGSKWAQTHFRCLGFCPELHNISNGKVSHVTPQVGKAAIEFRCENRSFQLIGRTRLECIDGHWNGELPYCHKLPSCASLQRPANGILHGSDNSHSAEAKFTCFTGFDLFGASTLTCNKGFWSSRVPTCKAHCTKIRDPPNGRVFGSGFSHGQVVTFRCKHGYELVGDRTLHCINGRWNSSLPQCKVMKCAKPSIPSNSRIIYPRLDQARYPHGTTLYLACHNGHLLTGSPIMVCNYTTWLKREFRCIASCPILGPIRNGVITHVTLKGGGEVKMKCHANYTLVGSSRLSCINGKWNDSIPSCKASCIDPGSPANGKKRQQGLGHNSWVSFSCNKNYHLEGERRIQCNDGAWSDILPKCVVADCGPLQKPDRGDIIEQVAFTYGNRIVFDCTETGYEMKGSKVRTCQGDGTWSGSPTTCEIVQCGDPGTLQNGKQTVTKGYVYGGSVKFKCNKGYTLVGTRIIYCQANKEWSAAVPHCRGKCKFLGRPRKGYTPNGYYQKDQYFPHGSSIEYACDSFYTLDGSSTLHCNDGAWNGSLPSCKKSCIDPGYIGQGKRIGTDFSHGKVVTYECNGQNYSLLGKSRLTCHDGKWDSDPPSCKKSCAPLTPLFNGKIHNHTVSHEALISFSCNSGFQLYGPQQIKCLNGKWNDSSPSCIGVCSKPRILMNGRVIGRSYSYGSVIKFECNEGYELRGSPSTTCRRGAWKGQFPECEMCVQVGAIFWGFWAVKTNATNYWKARITSITVTHVDFELVINKRYTRRYRRTDEVLIIDKVPSIWEVSPYSRVIANQFSEKNEGWYRTGTATRTSGDSLVFVKFDDGKEKWIPLEKVRLVSRPRFCSDVK